MGGRNAGPSRSGSGDDSIDEAWARIVAELTADPTSADADSPDGTDDGTGVAAAGTGDGSTASWDRHRTGSGSAPGPPTRRRDDVPDVEDEDDPGDADGGYGPTLASGPSIVAGPSIVIGPRDYDLPEDEDDGAFVPPTPGPVFGGDPLITMAWCGVVAASLMLFALLFWPTMPTVLRLGSLGALLLSFGVLLWRLPTHRAERDDDEGTTF